MQEYDIALLTYIREIRQKILSMYNSGASVAKIAKEIDLTVGSVYRHLRDMGVVLKARKRNFKTGQFLKGD